MAVLAETIIVSADLCTSFSFLCVAGTADLVEFVENGERGLRLYLTSIAVLSAAATDCVSNGLHICILGRTYWRTALESNF